MVKSNQLTAFTSYSLKFKIMIKNRFVPLFISLDRSIEQQQNNDPCLQIQIQNLTINPEISKLYEKIDWGACIGFAGERGEINQYLKKMILTNYRSNDRFDESSLEVTQVFSKIELAVNDQRRPIEWLYLEYLFEEAMECPQGNGINYKQNVEAMLSICSYLLVEVTSDGKLITFIHIYKHLMKELGQLFGSNRPHIYLIAKEDKSHKQSMKQLLLKYLPERQHQYFTLLTFYSNQIQSQGSLSSMSSIPISYEQLPAEQQISYFLKNMLSHLNNRLFDRINLSMGKMMAVYQIVRKGGSRLQNLLEICDKTVEQLLIKEFKQFQIKMEELFSGKQPIPLQQYHKEYKNHKSEAIEAVHSKLVQIKGNFLTPQQQIQSKQAFQLTISRLEEKLTSEGSLFESRNQANIIDWSISLLDTQFDSLQKKLGKYIKSMSTFKEEFINLQLSFKKKMDKYTYPALKAIIADFLITKVLESIQKLEAFSGQNLRDNLKESRDTSSKLELEFKDLKKRYCKQQSELNGKIIILKEKLNLEEIKNNLMQGSIETLKKQMEETTEQEERRIYQINEQFIQQKSLLNKKIGFLQEKQSQLGQQIILLQTKLQNEQLLRIESQQQYTSLLSNKHVANQNIQNQLNQVCSQSQLEISQLKQSQIRDIENIHLAKSRMVGEIESLEIEIKQKEKELVRVQALRSKQNMEAQKLLSKMESHCSDMEVKLKVNQQMNMQNCILKERVQKLEQELYQSRKQKEEYMQLGHHYEKQTLIMKNRLVYLTESLNNQQQLNKSFSQKKEGEVRELRRSLQDSRLSTKIKVDQWIQVEDNTMKQKLRVTLEMVKELEIQYSKKLMKSRSELASCQFLK